MLSTIDESLVLDIYFFKLIKSPLSKNEYCFYAFTVVYKQNSSIKLEIFKNLCKHRLKIHGFSEFCESEMIALLSKYVMTEYLIWTEEFCGTVPLTN